MEIVMLLHTSVDVPVLHSNTDLLEYSMTKNMTTNSHIHMLEKKAQAQDIVAPSLHSLPATELIAPLKVVVFQCQQDSYIRKCYLLPFQTEPTYSFIYVSIVV